MGELLGQAHADILLLPEYVQIWMRWLNIAFLPGIIFAKNHATARWAIAAYLIGFPVAIPIYYFTKDISLLGIPHFLFWGPLLFYIFRYEFKNPHFMIH